MTNAGDVFFLKPVFHGPEFITLNKQQRPFFVTEGTGSGSLDVRYGRFEARQQINEEVLQAALGDAKAMGNRYLLGDHDLSAHLVQEVITPERTQLQVLFHSSASQRDASTSKTHSLFNNSAIDGALCAHVFIRNNELQLRGSCMLTQPARVCLAQIRIPRAWWTSKTQLLDVKYFVTSPTRAPPLFALQCSDVTPSHDTRSERNVGAVTLSRDQQTLSELKEDLNVIVYLPRDSLHPGSKFRVPVKLEVGSTIREFEIKCVRHIQCCCFFSLCS